MNGSSQLANDSFERLHRLPFTNTPRSNMCSLSFNVRHAIFMGAGRVYLIESELQRLHERRASPILLNSFLEMRILD